MKVLDTREDGSQLLQIDALDEVDLQALLDMVDGAWRLDYAGEPREDFDEPTLRKMMRGGETFGVVSTDADGAPTGLELAMKRKLWVPSAQRELCAYYVTAFSVSPDHRRRGLGKWVLGGINRVAFEERGADLIVSTFHDGHAGSPTVQATFDAISGWGVCRFHRSPIFSRRLDQEPLAPADPPVRALRLFVPAGAEELAAEDRAGACAAPLQRAELHDWVRHGVGATFLWEGSFRERFLHERGAESGTLWIDFGDGAEALALYDTMAMSLDERKLRPVGQLQGLFVRGGGAATADQGERVLRTVAQELVQRNCFALSLLDLGAVPAPALEELGFRPLDDIMAFAVRGPRENVELFEGLEPPFFLDWT